MGCNCIANCQRCSRYVDVLEEEIEHLKTELAKIKSEMVNLRDNYCATDEVRDVINNLLREGEG